MSQHAYIPGNQTSNSTSLPAINAAPAENYSTQYPAPMPLTVRISILNLQFMKTSNSKLKQQVLELQKYYYITSSEIETNRYSSLKSANYNQFQQCSWNAHYDQQHNELISRIEYSLNLIEQRLIQPKEKATSNAATVSCSDEKTSTRPTSSNTIAHRIMNNWYERNKEHPYPSYDTAEVIAKAGGITVEQVKKWFANKRLRHKNTKHITEIAKRRKRSRTVSQDDILYTGANVSD